MATCDIAAGRSKPCKTHLGGVQKLYLFNYEEDPFTVVGSECTALNANVTESFEYDLVGDGQVLTESKLSDRSAGVSVNTQTVTAILQGIDKDTSNELNAVTESYPHAVVKTRDGAYLAIGITDGVDISVEETSGATQSEFSGYTLTGVSIEKNLAPTLDEATVTAFLLTVAVNP
jgi:hypothetical protein